MRVFLDSSILVEWSKGAQVDLLNHLLADDQYELGLNQVVLSEYTYYLLIIEGGKAPMTLKRDGSIPQILAQRDPTGFLQTMNVLPNGNEITPEYLRLMQRYNLLPNDALILATCLLHGIAQLASHDTTDFGSACAGEGIRLVSALSYLLV